MIFLCHSRNKLPEFYALCKVKKINKIEVINLWFFFYCSSRKLCDILEVLTALCVKSLNQCPQWRQTLCTAVELGGSDSWLMYFESIICLTCFNFLTDECQSETWQNNNLSLFSLSMWGLIAEGFVVAGNNEHVVGELSQPLLLSLWGFISLLTLVCTNRLLYSKTVYILFHNKFFCINTDIHMVLNCTLIPVHVLSTVGLVLIKAIIIKRF